MEYRLGLTAEPFLYNESKSVAILKMNGNNKEEIKRKVIEDNIFQHKKTQSCKRSFLPVWTRVESLNNELLEVLINSDTRTSKLVLLYAIMKTDRLVFEFINEVYKDKIILMKDTITNNDFEFFFEQKSMQSEVLLKASDSTKAKLKQVVFKIMIDAGIIEKNGTDKKIVKPYINDNLKKLFLEDNGKIYLEAIGG